MVMNHRGRRVERVPRSLHYGYLLSSFRKFAKLFEHIQLSILFPWQSKSRCHRCVKPFSFLNSFYILLNLYAFSIGMQSLPLDVKQAAISLTYFKTTSRTYFANKVVLKRIYTNVILS